MQQRPNNWKVYSDEIDVTSLPGSDGVDFVFYSQNFSEETAVFSTYIVRDFAVDSVILVSCIDAREWSKGKFSLFLNEMDKTGKVIEHHELDSVVLNRESGSLFLGVNLDARTTGFNLGGYAWGQGNLIYKSVRSYTLSELAVGELEDSLMTIQQRNWLEKYTIPFNPSDEDSFKKALSEFSENLFTAHIIGMGENTHGTKQAAWSRNQLIDFLSDDEEFRSIIFEDDAVKFEQLNQFLTEDVEVAGVIKPALQNIVYRNNANEELLKLIGIVKSRNNRRRSNKIRFAGIDLQSIKTSQKEIEKFISDYGDSVMFHLFRNNIDLVRFDKNQNDYDPINKYSIRVDAALRMIDSLAKTVNTGIDDNTGVFRSSDYIRQYINLDQKSRDEYMAVNTLEKVAPGQHGVLWAHNEHLRLTCCRAGYFLRDSLNEKYLAIGMTFSSGMFWGAGPDGPNTYPATVASEGSLEKLLEQLPYDALILDLRSIRLDDSVQKEWLARKRPFRVVGIYHDEEQFDAREILQEYDYIIYFRIVQPTENFYYERGNR